MKAHRVTLDLYDDQTARLVAVDFETRRVLVTWGGGIMACTSGFEFRAKVGYRRCAASYSGCALVEDARAGEKHWSTVGLIADAPAQRSSQRHGARTPCLRFPPGEWHRFTPSQSWATQTRRGRITSMQALGPCYDDLIFTPVIPIGEDTGREVELSGLVSWLRSVGVPAPSTSKGARPIGAWLHAMRKKLMHGYELCELTQEHHCPPLSGAGLDILIKPLVKAGIVRPYSFDPSTPQGIRVHASNEQQAAMSFARALAGEMRDERMHSGGEYSDEEWATLCQSLGVLPAKAGHYGAATGSIFWYFTQGEKFADMPSFVL